MSRKPSQHSYVPYTGIPYIRSNGVNYTQNTSCPVVPEYPFRTIVRSLKPDGHIIDHVPAQGMGNIEGVAKMMYKKEQQVTQPIPMVKKEYFMQENDAEAFTLDRNYTMATQRRPAQLVPPTVNAMGCPSGKIWPFVTRKDNLYKLYQINNALDALKN